MKRKDKIDWSKQTTIDEVLGRDPVKDAEGNAAASVLRVVAWSLFGGSIVFAAAGNVSASAFLFFSFIAVGLSAFARKK